LALEWLLAALAALVSVSAFSAFLASRRLTKRVERLSESYWELRYELGQLSARLARLEGTAARNDQPSAPEAGVPGGVAAFVPLSSLKKM